MRTVPDHALADFLAWLLLENPGPLPTALHAGLPDRSLRTHGLAPLAYAHGVERFKPAWIQNALAAEVRKQTLEEILDAFGEEAIDVCLLKGTAYVRDLYENDAERPMGDLDLLVRDEQIQHALSVLARLGFAPREGKDFMFAPTHHALTLDRRHLSVDLHRNMAQAWRSKLDFDAIWSRACAETHRLEHIDEVVLHLTHMARHEMMVPLHSYVDLSRLLRRPGSELRSILARADDARVGRGARAVLRMQATLARGSGGGRGSRYPLPSASEVRAGVSLLRTRQLAAKAMLVDGPRELIGLGAVTFYERAMRRRANARDETKARRHPAEGRSGSPWR